MGTMCCLRSTKITLKTLLKYSKSKLKPLSNFNCKCVGVLVLVSKNGKLFE